MIRSLTRPLAGLVALAATPAFAASFVYEGFATSDAPAPSGQYTDGQLISDAPGGTGSGWTGDWSSTLFTAETGSLAVSGLEDTPGRLVTATSSTGSQRGFSSTGFDALGDEVWFSFAMRHDDVQGDQDGKRFSVLFADRDSANRFIGLDIQNNSLDMTARIDPANTADTTSSDSFTITIGQTHFVIGRITFDEGAGLDRLDVWVDESPTNNPGELGTPTMFVEADWSGTQGTSHNALDRIVIADALSQFSVDEIRVGGSLADAVQLIPEPASLALLGAGGLVMLARRRTAA